MQGRLPCLLVLILLLAGCASRDLVYKVPEHGTALPLTMRVCRPSGDAPGRVIVINHGTPALASDRVAMRPEPCSGEVAQWFLARGYVVAFPMRRGHGDGARLAETSGSCEAPNYVQSGLVAASDVAAAVDYASALPFVQHGRAVVIGQSTGGWATVAYASLPHPLVSGVISMAGGRGAEAGGIAGQMCRPDLLEYSAAYFATTSSTPELWVYAANDRQFTPPAAQSLVAAFRGAGGVVTYAPVGAFDADGHRLFFGPGGSAVWGPIVARYLNGT